MFGAAEPAQAQSSAESDDAIDEIIVTTARRREESLQEVPLAITVLSGVDLERVGAADIIEIGKKSPNVTLEVSRGTNSTLSSFIRGVGQQDPVAGYESGVGLYVDDVYFNRPHAAVLELYEVERVEVLRGPQGTLYGRNTIGGAIKYVTKRIEDEPEAKVRAAIGTDNQFDVLLSASGALSDTFRLGGTVANFTRDGFGDNLTLGTEQYDKDVLGMRISAEWDTTDSLFFRLSGDYTKDESSPKAGHRLLVGGINGDPILGDVFDTRAGLNVPKQDVESYGVSLLGQLAISDQYTLKAILASRSDSTFSPIDFDSLPTQDLDVPVNYENDQFSGELQLLYSGDRLNGVAGFYYLDANAFNDFDVLLAELGDVIGLPGLNANTIGDVDTQTWSVFADFSYDLTDTTSLSIGGRYTSDERDSIVLRTTYIGGFSSTFGGSAIPIATTSDFNGSDEWNEFSPRVSLSWAPSDGHNFFVSYSEGFKGGGFDPRGQTSAATDSDGNPTVDPDEIFAYMNFLPETVKSYEAGWNATAMDGRLTSRIAVFFGDYEDVQVPGSVGVDTNGDGINDTFAGSTTNAGKAELPGIELEGLFRANDNMSLNWAIGYLDADYKEYVVNGVEVSDIAVFQNTPEWTANAGLTFESPVSWFGRDGDLFIIPSVAYRSETSQFEFPNPLLDQPSYTLLDLSVVWEGADGKWSFGLHGKNLGDEEYKVAGYAFGPTGGNLGLEGNDTAFYGNPLTITATAEYRW
jgi:iron complex outermembrane receptor protein